MSNRSKQHKKMNSNRRGDRTRREDQESQKSHKSQEDQVSQLIEKTKDVVLLHQTIKPLLICLSTQCML